MTVYTFMANHPNFGTHGSMPGGGNFFPPPEEPQGPPRRRGAGEEHAPRTFILICIIADMALICWSWWSPILFDILLFSHYMALFPTGAASLAMFSLGAYWRMGEQVGTDKYVVGSTMTRMGHDLIYSTVVIGMLIALSFNL